MKPWYIALSAYAVFVTGCISLQQGLYVEPYQPRRVGVLQAETLDESSGLVQSTKRPGWFWTHNDSGGEPQLFCINEKGTLPEAVKQAGLSGMITIKGVKNNDWEDLAMDGQGNLYVGDMGNNKNRRRDLKIYRLPEPDPHRVSTVQPTAVYRFEYPDQTAFPPAKNNFDCEALFWMHGHMHLLTKHRSNEHTKLYRFDSYSTEAVNTLSLLQEVALGGQVTSADADAANNRLVVLTYGSLWLFDVPGPEVDLTRSGLRWLPLDRSIAQQCEAVCFDGDRILLTNEQRSVLQVPIQALRPHRRLEKILRP